MQSHAILVCAAMVVFATSARAMSLDQLIVQAEADNAGMHFGEAEDEDSPITVEYDILMTPEQYAEHMAHRLGRKAYRPEKNRWTNKVVPYQISDLFTQENKEQIQAAFREWETNTCIDFRPVRSSDTNYIILQNGAGCLSFVGMINKPQPVYLAPGCRYKGVVVHELGHAIGFNHEQTRPDRDAHVQILYQNIKDDKEFNFQKFDDTITNTYGVPYDYHSVMHYGKTAFSNNGQITIKTKDPSYQDTIGKSSDLSFADIKLANLMYNCGERCPTTSCPGEGFVSKDCQCRCRGADGHSIELCSGGGGGGGSCSASSQGNHGKACLQQWWQEAGCSPDGTASPDNSPSNVNWWNGRSGSGVQNDMALYFQYGSDPNSHYYEKCHGDPKACPASKQGPHTLFCLQKWWEEAGCFPQGTGSPDNNPSNVQWWNDRSGANVQNDMESYSSLANSNHGYRVKCYGDGPICDDDGSGSHGIECLRLWWQEAGCYPAGRSSPSNDPGNVAWWNNRSAQSVRSDMATYARLANEGVGNYRVRCRGSSKKRENTECEDTGDYCDLWKEKGYCAMFRSVMEDRCAKACGTCD